MESTRLSDGSTLHVAARGRLRLATGGRGACLATCEGDQVGEFGKLVARVGDELIAAHGRCVFLVDSFDSPRMDTEFREVMTAWFRRQMSQVPATAHVLLRSKLIEMAVHVANLVTGSRFAFPYTNIVEWEAFGKTEMGPGFRRRPLSAYLESTPRVTG
jgi:hypothetical protein